MPFTEEQRREYINNCGDCCPFCKGRCLTGFTGARLDSSGSSEELINSKECLDCGKEWVEIIKIVGIEETPDRSKHAPQT